MTHNADQLAAARDLLADGATPAEIAQAIADQFGVSLRTGFRVADAVSDDMTVTESATDTRQAKPEYLLSAIDCMHRQMVAAADAETAFDRAERLVAALAKLKTTRLPL